MNKTLQKGLFCVGLSVISASAFAAQTFTVFRSNNSGFIISHITGTGGSLPSGGSTISSLLVSPDALPTVNDILTLRGPGFGNGSSANTAPALSLLPLLNENISTTNGGKGKFSTLGLDTALLAVTRGN